MHVVKTVLSSVQGPSPQVQSLLACLQDAAFQTDVYVCSFGGVGSTELSNFLNRTGLSTNLISDSDALRHTNKPPAFGPHNCPKHVVYMYGNPWASIASHYRRKQAFHQALKTSGNSKLSETDFPASFEGYVAKQQDLFGLEEHFHNWLTTKCGYDVTFVRYENLFDTDVVATLFSILYAGKKDVHTTQQLATNFVGLRKERSSKVPAELQPGMYKELCCQMDSLPSIFKSLQAHYNSLNGRPKEELLSRRSGDGAIIPLLPPEADVG